LLVFTRRRRFFRGDAPYRGAVFVPRQEAALLRYFVQREGCPVPRNAILEEVWGLRDDTDTRAIDNFILRLRRYIEDDPTSPLHLQTVRGVGYRFVANPD
jgi:DNA-binding response OmpR family regulator